MKTYYIRCGDLKGYFKGKDIPDAFIRAVKRKRPKRLGVLFRARLSTDPSDDQHVFYFDTEYWLWVHNMFEPYY